MAGKGNKARRQIVSSAHLVSERAAALSAYEYGLILGFNAFSRWIVRCMTAAGYADDLCFVLNIEDTHLVNYSLKKLGQLGLVGRSRRGKENHYAATAAGAAACRKYKEVREACLIAAFDAFGGERGAAAAGQVDEAADLLRALSGLYDQAARAAASL
jgi:predicted MarR family transcription regulator